MVEFICGKTEEKIGIRSLQCLIMVLLMIMSTGFQVTFGSRMHNGDEHPAEIYYSNGGELNLNTNKVSPTGGLTKRFADEMKMQPNLLPEMSLSEVEKVVVSANTGGDNLTSNHIRNWMECVRSRKTTECAGGSRVQSLYCYYYDKCCSTYGS